MNFIEKRIVPITEKMGKQRHLKAVRDGVIQSLPLILLGSFFLLLAQPPGQFLENLVKPYLPVISIPFRFTFGMISLYVACTVAYSLAKSYELPDMSTAMLAGVVFLISATPRVVVESEGISVLSIPKGDMGFNIPITYFGSKGLFLAIVSAIITVEILRYLRSKKLMFSMPESVPDVVAKAFEAIIPSLVIVVIFWGIRDMLKVDLPAVFESLFTPIVRLGNSLATVIVLTLIDSICWFAGIHPVAVTGPFARTVWLSLLEENAAAAMQMGKDAILPNIAVDQFYFWFVWVGGAGGTLGLAFMTFFAKSKQLRQLGKISIIPGIFNINEPIIFGMPIVANPLMIIPFTLAPIVAGTVAYIAFMLNLARRPYLQAPWTMPAPLGAYFSTGGDWRALVLSCVSIVISALIYLPFLKVFDTQLYKKEQAFEKEEPEEPVE